MMMTTMALRLASKRNSSTTSLFLFGRRLLIVQEEQQQRQRNLWTVPDSRQGFQLSPQNVQAHPEMASQIFRRMSMEDDDRRNDYAYGVSHTQEQESLDAWRFVVLSDPRIQDQLRRNYDQLSQPVVKEVKKETSTFSRVDNAPLPKTIEDALRPTRRAIVITEAQKPFRVFDVNRAWEELCGYSYVESKGKTLGSLLRGPETDQLAATSLIAKLLQGEDEAGTTLVNYTKSGRCFQNRIRVGPLKDGASGHVNYFVGVLQEVKM